MPAVTVAWALRQLEKEYGPFVARPRVSPLSELIRTVLSQNTSDINSDRAFAELTSRFRSWEDVLRASQDEIADAIRAGGLANVKAPRIKSILEEIVRQRGKLDLGFVGDMPMDEAMDWLRRLPGVGPKTAACVLLFSLGMPALPVDTHVLRVAQRLGLVSRRSTAEKAADVLSEMVPRKDVYRLHVYYITHGRRICRSQRPLCQRCMLNERCPSAFMFD